jgi:hypothetical protein
MAYTSIQGGMIGQSNMENFPKTPDIYPLGAAGTTAYSRAGIWQRIGNINDARPAGQQSSLGSFTASASDNGAPIRGDGLVFFANALRAAADVPVRLIERAKGGSLISSWIDPGAGPANNWSTFRDAVIAAGGGLDFAIWYQGEQNAHNLNPVTHVAALNTVYQQCLTLSGKTADKFFFGVISIGGLGAYNSTVVGESGAMRALLCEWANSTPGVFLATSAHDGWTSDGVHQTGKPFGWIGNRAGKTLANKMGFGGVSGAGPRISNFTRVSRAVTANIVHTGGTSLMDGAGGTAGTALTGFEFKDDNGVIAHTTAFVGGNIVCTLDRDVVGSLTGSYAMMDAPYSASSTVQPTAAAVVYDNAIYFGSTIGCPLQPRGALTIL